MYQEDAERHEHEAALRREEDDRRKGTYSVTSGGWEKVPEEITERRLEIEARTVNLGNLIHRGALNHAPADRVKVEVTYQVPGDIEHSGFFLVYVPSIEPTGDDELDMANHPVQLASDRVYEWTDTRDYEYFSIDDTFSA
jgi:hypothetical protein